MRKALRQGDILLLPVSEVRGERIQPVNGGYIIAEGEQTGHHHSVVEGPNVAVFRDRDSLFVQSDTKLVHQEHGELQLSGSYEVVQQRRASSFEERVMRAVD